MNTSTDTTVKVSPEVQARREAATSALKVRMHRAWHEARNIEPCARLACDHPWL